MHLQLLKNKCINQLSQIEHTSQMYIARALEGGGGNFAQDSNFPKIGSKIFDIMKVHNKAIGKVKNF